MTIRFKLAGKEYRLGFSHDTKDLPARAQRKTSAFIIDGEGKRVSEASALCSKLDNFNKEVGRRVALDRLLRNEWGLTADTTVIAPRNLWKAAMRREVWAAYEGRK